MSKKVTFKSHSISFPVLPIVIGISALLIISIGTFLTLQLLSEPPQNASFEVSAPKETLLGQPFVLDVKIGNNSGEVFRSGKLTIFLPPEMNFTGKSSDERVLEEPIGIVEKLGLIGRQISIIAASGTESVSHIQAKFSYMQAGVNAQFEKSKTIDILIGAPAINLDFTTPEKILNGGNFDTRISVTNQSSEEIAGLSLVLNFPKEYTLVSSDIPTSGTSTWSIGSLKSGEVKILTVTGNLTGQENDFMSIGASLRRNQEGAEYVLSEKTASLNIAAPPLSFTIQSNMENVAHLSEQLNYTVNVTNNTEIPMENLTMKATLVGEMFNLSSVKTGGVWNAVNNTVMWSSANTPGLLRLPPGQTQTVNFSVQIKDRFPITRQSDKNFVLKVNGSAETPTVLPNVSVKRTLVTVRNETKVAGAITLENKAYRKDPSGAFQNTGPYPPKANQTTEYTVHWVLRNSGTDMSQVEVSSFLEPYGRLVGKPISNIDIVPIYNSASGQIIWKIDKIPATVGTISPAPETIFQIEVTPPTPYIGHDATLLRATTLRANDNFVSHDFSFSSQPLLSNLPDDQTLGNLDRSVQP